MRPITLEWFRRLNGFPLGTGSSPCKSGTREGEVLGRLLHLLHSNLLLFLLLLRQTRSMFPGVCTLVMLNYRLWEGHRLSYLDLCERGGYVVGGKLSYVRELLQLYSHIH